MKISMKAGTYPAFLFCQKIRFMENIKKEFPADGTVGSVQKTGRNKEHRVAYCNRNNKGLGIGGNENEGIYRHGTEKHGD